MLRLPHGVVTAVASLRFPGDRRRDGGSGGPADAGRAQLRRRWRDVLAPWDLSPHQARALGVVARRDGVRLTDLAEALHIAPRSATEVADGLQSVASSSARPIPVTAAS